MVREPYQSAEKQPQSWAPPGTQLSCSHHPANLLRRPDTIWAPLSSRACRWLPAHLKQLVFVKLPRLPAAAWAVVSWQ